jgi:hypothetical protein
MPHPLLLEINTRSWLRALAGTAVASATLADVPEAVFQDWQRSGFTHIWLMGVWSSGPRARAAALADAHQRAAFSQALPGWREEDVAGSPYAIADYRVPEALGGESGLNGFRRRLQARGMKLVLDFVPNHLGLDHPWLSEQPDWFVQSPKKRPGTFPQATRAGTRWLAHGRDPFFPPWSDTVQVEYRSSAACAAMIGLLRSVAGRCDGVRCDMAMLLLSDIFARTWGQFPGPALPSTLTDEFWASAIPAIKGDRPEFLFLAEVYWGLEPRLQELGFDYTYDKALYDFLVARDATGVQGHLLGLTPRSLAAGAHFLENHDEPPIASLLSPEEHRAAALVILGLPGMRFLHEGQLRGARARVPVHLVRRPAELESAEVREIYSALLAALPRTAVGRGKAELLAPGAAWPDNPTAGNFVIVQWQSEGMEFDLVVANLASNRSQCYVPLRVPALESRQWTLQDLLGQETYLRSGDELQSRGLYLDLPAHGAQLFHFQPGP